MPNVPKRYNGANTPDTFEPAVVRWLYRPFNVVSIKDPAGVSERTATTQSRRGGSGAVELDDEGRNRRGIRVARLVDEAVAEKHQAYVTRTPPTPRSVLRLDRAHSAQSISWTRTDRNTSTSLAR